MNQKKIEKLAEDLAYEWYCDDYQGDTWWVDDIVEQFILWIYKNGGEVERKKSNRDVKIFNEKELDYLRQSLFITIHQGGHIPSEAKEFIRLYEKIKEEI